MRHCADFVLMQCFCEMDLRSSEFHGGPYGDSYCKPVAHCFDITWCQSLRPLDIDFAKFMSLDVCLRKASVDYGMLLELFHENELGFLGFLRPLATLPASSDHCSTSHCNATRQSA